MSSDGASKAKLAAAAEKYAKFKCDKCNYAGFTSGLLETHRELSNHWSNEKPKSSTQQVSSSGKIPELKSIPNNVSQLTKCLFAVDTSKPLPASSNYGGRPAPSNYGGLPPCYGTPPPSYFRTQPPPLFGQQPPSFGQQSPSFGQQLSFGQQPLSFGQTFPSFGQPPPLFEQPPPSFVQPPPSFVRPPPSFVQPPPSFEQPPPSFQEEHYERLRQNEIEAERFLLRNRLAEEKEEQRRRRQQEMVRRRQDRDRDNDRDKDRNKDSNSDSDRDNDRDKDRDSDKDRDNDSDKDSNSDSDRDNDRDKDRDSDKDRDNDRDKDRDREDLLDASPKTQEILKSFGRPEIEQSISTVTSKRLDRLLEEAYHKSQTPAVEQDLASALLSSATSVADHVQTEDIVDSVLERLITKGGKTFTAAIKAGIVAQLFELKRQGRESQQRVAALLSNAAVEKQPEQLHSQDKQPEQLHSQDKQPEQFHRQEHQFGMVEQRQPEGSEQSHDRFLMELLRQTEKKQKLENQQKELEELQRRLESKQAQETPHRQRDQWQQFAAERPGTSRMSDADQWRKRAFSRDDDDDEPIAAAKRPLQEEDVLDTAWVRIQETMRRRDIDNKTLEVRDVPTSCSTADLKALHPDIVGVRFTPGQNSGWLMFDNDELASGAKKDLNGIRLRGNMVHIDYSKSVWRPSWDMPVDPLRLHIRGMPMAVPDRQIRVLFPKCTDVELRFHPRGRSIFYYVTFASIADAREAFINGANLKLNGYPVEVFYARNKENETEPKQQHRHQQQHHQQQEQQQQQYQKLLQQQQELLLRQDQRQLQLLKQQVRQLLEQNDKTGGAS